MQRLTDALAGRPTALDIGMSKVGILTDDGAMTFLAAARIARTQGTQITVRNAGPQARATLHTLGRNRLQGHHDDWLPLMLHRRPRNPEGDFPRRA
ncbi:hypothetical protein [Streptomyces chartreusis]|uniref:hypothetical protein n=1 Tax=Streptomyces chartreusis TaxID=1969 RepID=UPI0033CD911F